MFLKYITLLGVVAFFAACQSQPATEIDSEIMPDTLENKWKIRDTVLLKQGEMPAEWEKTELGQGFYIGFPETPKRREYKEKKQVVYKLEKNNYALVITQTDLKADSSFQQNRRRPEEFYDAIFQDMATTLETKIELQEAFVLLKTYGAARADFRSESELISAQCVLIGNTLYTMSALLWKQDKTSLQQIRDYFFASFGKDLYIE